MEHGSAARQLSHSRPSDGPRCSDFDRQRRYRSQSKPTCSTWLAGQLLFIGQPQIVNGARRCPITFPPDGADPSTQVVGVQWFRWLRPVTHQSFIEAGKCSITPERAPAKHHPRDKAAPDAQRAFRLVLDTCRRKWLPGNALRRGTPSVGSLRVPTRRGLAVVGPGYRTGTGAVWRCCLLLV
jgi:hypothetical protein